MISARLAQLWGHCTQMHLLSNEKENKMSPQNERIGLPNQLQIDSRWSGVERTMPPFFTAKHVMR
jgi:hypothetical protein